MTIDIDIHILMKNVIFYLHSDYCLLEVLFLSGILTFAISVGVPNVLPIASLFIFLVSF